MIEVCTQLEQQPARTAGECRWNGSTLLCGHPLRFKEGAGSGQQNKGMFVDQPGSLIAKKGI